MNVLPTLALIGLCCTGIGLGWTAVLTGIEWHDLAKPTEYFLPRSVRRLFRRSRTVSVDLGTAHTTATVHGSAIVARQINPDASTKERLRALEAMVRDIEKNYQQGDQALRQELGLVKVDVESTRTEITALSDGIREQDRRKTVENLRRAGWSLSVAVLGLVMQLPAAIAAAVGA